jgi:hypothetical protein
MIRDPEQEPQRWDEPIVATSPEEAKEECQKRADEYDMELEFVTKPDPVEEGSEQEYRCNYKEKD